ncbi:LLM class flavin-dependent oxidoreductase [Corynebacterium vitaeruminis]|nr:LLM class flavin-dependent oxidoreductase [Corynebacterium vitaeruminis]
MQSFGFLSFGHHAIGNQQGPNARDVLHQAIDIAVAADELGVNGANFRVHHFAPQASSPIPLLSAIAARTSHIEVGTGVIDMR